MSEKSSDKALDILCWDGYDHPEFIDPFSREVGCQINARTLLSDHRAAQEILSASSPPDVININNPYPQKVLHPAGRIAELDPLLLSESLDHHLPWLENLETWQYSMNDKKIGVCQRFGSFNLVININKISRATAANVGFRIVHESHTDMPYGILLFPEFNIFHICIAADLNPFVPLDSGQLELFEQTARFWFSNSSLVTEDSKLINQTLIAGDIDYFLSGGIFVSGAARLEGHSQIECVTPVSGPIDGKGAIAFMEITSLTNNVTDMTRSYDYLNYILRPEIACQVATNPAVCNPIAQMADPGIFRSMSRKYLEAIQWDSLEEDIGLCAAYDIPPSFNSLYDRLQRAMIATI